jgi:hypothetical protein
MSIGPWEEHTVTATFHGEAISHSYWRRTNAEGVEVVHLWEDGQAEGWSWEVKGPETEGATRGGFTEKTWDAFGHARFLGDAQRDADEALTRLLGPHMACETCQGHGLVGGQLRDGSYEDLPCPETLGVMDI